MFGLLSGGDAPAGGWGPGPTPEQKLAIEIAYKRFFAQYKVYAARLLELSIQVEGMPVAFVNSLPPGIKAKAVEDSMLKALVTQAAAARAAADKLNGIVKSMQTL